MTMEKKRRHTYTLNFILIFFMLFLVGTRTAHTQTILTLEKALEIARENSPNIRSTRLNLERSQELLNAQRAALKSQFSFRFNPFNFSQDQTFYTPFSAWTTNKTKGSTSTFTISQPIKQTDGTLALTNRLSWQDSYSDYKDVRNISYSNNLAISFQQPIFTYNRTEMSTRQLELDLESTTLTYNLQKLSLERQVTSNFYSVYQNKTSLEIAQGELENQKQSYEIIKNKVDAGLQALEELYQAELNLASSQSNLQNRQVSLENSLDNFKLLIGLPLNETITVDTDVTYQEVKVDLDKALETGLKNRLEMRQQNISMENAQYSLIQTAAQNEFKGYVTLSYGIIGTDENFGNMFEVPTKQQTVGLSFDIPIWDWGQKKSRINASRASIERNKISLEDERNSIIIEITKTSRSLNNLVNQIEIARQNVRNAELTYEINLERYKNGDLTSMDLNLFQSQLSQKRNGIVQALISYKLALLDMKIQSLWDFERNQPVLPELTNDLK